MSDRPSDIPTWLKDIKQFYNVVYDDIIYCQSKAKKILLKDINFNDNIMMVQSSLHNFFLSIDKDAEFRNKKVEKLTHDIIEQGKTVYTYTALLALNYISKKINNLQRWYNKKIYPSNIRRYLISNVDEIEKLIREGGSTEEYSESTRIFKDSIKLAMNVIDEYENQKIPGLQNAIKKSYFVWGIVATIITGIIVACITILIQSIINGS